MSKPLLALCSIPKVAVKDGYTGPYAKLLLPFVGYWFASGQTFTFPNSTIAQDTSRTIGGTRMADTFAKDCCSCVKG